MQKGNKNEVRAMKNKLIEILRDMSGVAFTNKEKADYLMQHDVVSVVKCKDCKFAEPYMSSSGKEMNACCINDLSGLEPDDYCSYGERIKK